MKLYPVKGLRVDGTVVFITVSNQLISMGYRYTHPPAMEYVVNKIWETIEHLALENLGYTSYDYINENAYKYGIYRGKPINLSEWFKGTK